MIDLGPHANFIISAYLGVVVVISLLIVWVAANSKKQQNRLAGLDERGIVRRSQNKE